MKGAFLKKKVNVKEPRACYINISKNLVMIRVERSLGSQWP